MWVSPARSLSPHARKRVRGSVTALLLLLITLAACGPKGSNQPPVTDDGNTGSLAITVKGLNGVAADIKVTGPGAFSWDGTEATTLENLTPGDYIVTASPVAEFVVVGDAVQTVPVTADAESTVTVRYSDAAVALSGASSLTVPLQKAAQVEFTIDRRGAFKDEVEFTVEGIPGLSVSPLTGTIPTGSSTFTVTVQDDEAELGDYPLAVSVTGEFEGRPLTDSATVTVSLVAVVTDGGDDDEDPIPGSLRALLEDERTEGATITFDPGLHETGPLVIELTDTLDITSNVGIQGPDWQGAETEPLVVLDGRDAFRVMRVANAAVTVTNLQLRKGAEQHGAGVMVEGAKLTLVNSHLRNNNASLGVLNDRRGGAIWLDAGSTVELEGSHVVNNTAGNWGGGIYVVAGTISEPTRLVVSDSTVSGNHAELGGGIYVNHAGFGFQRAFLEIRDSEITGNSAADGGGITNYGEATIEGSLIQDNTASGDGGGIRNHLRMSISNTEILENKATNHYGGLFNDGIMTVSDSRIAENTAGGNGAGIFNGWPGSDEFANGDSKQLHIERSLVADNVAGNNGGGIHSVRKLTIIDSRITGNVAANEGGGIYAVSYAEYAPPVNNGGELHISGTTIDDNHAGTTGGGIYSGTILGGPNNLPDASFTLLNSTVTANTARWGGGIYLGANNTGAARLNFNTIARNDAIGVDGQVGGVDVNRTNVTIRGNLIVQNTGASGVDTRDVFAGPGQVTSLGHNFISTVPANVNRIPNDVDIYGGIYVGQSYLQLGELEDNGGPTPTMALGTLSSAAARVSVSGCVSTDGTALTVDQRGLPRPVASKCSIGAYQLQG